MHKKVMDVHKRVKLRGQKSFTAKLSDSDIEKYCVLNEEAQNTMNMAVERFALSFRSIKKVQKVSRTIADLDACEIIDKRHILEALSYRRR
jgi:magnesium chelatase family protein